METTIPKHYIKTRKKIYIFGISYYFLLPAQSHFYKTYLPKQPLRMCTPYAIPKVALINMCLQRKQMQK